MGPQNSYIIILLFEKVVCLNPDEAKGELNRSRERDFKVDPQKEEEQLDSPEDKESPEKIEINAHNHSQSEIQLYQINEAAVSSPSIVKRVPTSPTKESMRQFEIDKEKAIKRIADKEANVTCCALGLIIAALSIHSFFEGLALGVSSQQNDVLGLIIGISLHNWAESLAIVRVVLIPGR